MVPAGRRARTVPARTAGRNRRASGWRPAPATEDQRAATIDVAVVGATSPGRDEPRRCERDHRRCACAVDAQRVHRARRAASRCWTVDAMAASDRPIAAVRLRPTWTTAGRRLAQQAPRARRPAVTDRRRSLAAACDDASHRVSDSQSPLELARRRSPAMARGRDCDDDPSDGCRAGRQMGASSRFARRTEAARSARCSLRCSTSGTTASAALAAERRGSTRCDASLRDGATRRDQPRQQASLERAHRRLLVGLRVVPAADVQGAVGRRAGAARRRRPADVAGLAAPAGLGLLDRPLDRDDDVAEVGPAARRQRERPAAGVPARPSRPGCGGNASGGSSGNDSTSVGPSLAHVRRVQAGELGVVGEDQPDRRRRRRAGRVERRGHEPGRAPRRAAAI